MYKGHQNYPHRTMCDILGEMRAIMATNGLFTHTYVNAVMSSLIEEAQAAGNRMEAGLYYKRDIGRLHTRRARLLKKVAALEAKLPEEDRDTGF